MLHRGYETTAERVDIAKALWAVLNQTIRPSDAIGFERMLGLLEEMLTRIPVFEVYCTKDVQAAEMVKGAMTAQENG